MIDARTPEWVRLARGWPAAVLCSLPLESFAPRTFLWLLPYAGDWWFRHERRAAMRQQTPTIAREPGTKQQPE